MNPSTLAQISSAPKPAAMAVPLLQQAVDGYGSDYAHSRALNLPALAAAHALIGDLDAAARNGHEAAHHITALASPRAYDRLRTLHAVLQPHDINPAISEARDKIWKALTAA